MSRRRIIGSVSILVLAVGIRSGGAFATDSGLPIGQAPADEQPPMNYRVVHGWPVLPENSILDEVSAVAVNARGDVLVLQRGGRKWPDSDTLDQTPIPVPTIFVFDGRTGRLLTKWGEKLFALPHSLTVDREDNVWVTDVALHQIYKFSRDGKLLLTLGERGTPGADTSHFNRPTDVAVGPDGSFYVSDGYRNSRVLKFSRAGRFLSQWGTRGTGPGQFNLPHGIATDVAGRILVVDRQNARIQVFDRASNYVTQWTGVHFVSPQDIAVASDGTAFVVDIGDDKLPDRSGVLVFKRDGSLIGRFGRYGNYDGQFLIAHGVAVGKGGEVYVADFTGRRVQKFIVGKQPDTR